MDDAPNQAEYDKLRKTIQDALRTPKIRPNWNHSQLCQNTVEYILQRETVLEARKAISKIDWQHINPNNRELAEQIKEQVLHSLTVMVGAMRRTEIDHL